MARFKPAKFSIKPNQNKEYIKHIDTTVFYMAVFSEEFIKEYNLENFKSGIKFYGEGKVGHFKGIDLNKAASFNPKKATMGYYNYSDEGFFVEYVYEIPGGTYKVAKNQIILRESSRDTLVIKTFQSATSAEKITKYVKKKIPKEALQYHLDW
ncbi:hypothetical protein [Kordia sp.]|uniref:hypothetical protein n=1 Tax=Kordia sp. TaxID=1965332 RepID=UPI003D29F051